MSTIAVIQFATPLIDEQRAPGYLVRRLAEAIADCLSLAAGVTVRNPLLTSDVNRHYLLLAKPLTKEQALDYASHLQAEIVVSGLLIAADELELDLMLYAADGSLTLTQHFRDPLQASNLAAICRLILEQVGSEPTAELEAAARQTLGTDEQQALLAYWAARDASARYGIIPVEGDNAFTLALTALQQDPSYQRAAALAAEIALDLAADTNPPPPATLDHLVQLQAITNGTASAPVTAAAYFSLGLRADERHDNRTALQLYQLALAAHPDDIAATAHLGDLRYRLGMRDQALSLLQRAYELNPSDDHSAFLIARIYEQNEQPRTALDWYAHAAAARADFWQAHFYAADLLRRQGDLEAAVTEFERTLAIDPQQAQTHAELGTVLAELGRPAEALPHLEQAAAALPGVSEIQANIATVKQMLAH